MTTRTLLFATVLGIAVLPSCSGDDDSPPTSEPPVTAGTSSSPSSSSSAEQTTDEAPTTTDTGGATSTTEPRPDAVVDVDVEPGQATDDFVGARQDVTVDRCLRRGDGWVAAGSVTNSSGADAAYRIYVAFNVDGTADTRGLVQVDVDVADGATEDWRATAPVPEDNLVCILRVERVAAD